MSETKSPQLNTVKSPNVAHWIACTLVAVTGVLLTFGALVTTYEAAMAVPDWPGLSCGPGLAWPGLASAVARAWAGLGWLGGEVES